MYNLNRDIDGQYSSNVSAYYDYGVKPGAISHQQREDNIELVIERYFVGNGTGKRAASDNLLYEAIVRSIIPDDDFSEQLAEVEEQAEGGFGPQLIAPSTMVEDVLREYGYTDLGAVALARLIAWDNLYIERGWRESNGALTDEGIHAYGKGLWRPFRVASYGDGQDVVTPSGLLLLPDLFEEEYCSTGDLSSPMAVLHHEIKAHILPLKEGKGLEHGREMALICMRLESEMLRELGLPERRLEWGLDDGPLNQTLHEASEQFYHGLVRFDDSAQLVEIDPLTECVVGRARVLQE
jgi:hypothetical protein